MSVCGSSDTPAPEMERERVRTVVIWGIKSAGIEVRAAVGGTPSEFGGSKRGCHTAGVVFGDAIAAERGLGSRKSLAALQSGLSGSRKLSCCCLMGENKLELRISSCSAPGTVHHQR